MHLSEHLDTHGLTYSAFARQIGVSAETVRRYCNGERVPAPSIMRRIIRATEGKVTADSFYADTKAA
jgi:DNA-binding transcriptional regulator YdaS (Cro superfamily)